MKFFSDKVAALNLQACFVTGFQSWAESTSEAGVRKVGLGKPS
jgi:hypothetical protein